MLLILLPSVVAATLKMLDLLLIGLMMYSFNVSMQIHFLEVSGRDYSEFITLVLSLNPASFNIKIHRSLARGLVYNAAGTASLGYVEGLFILITNLMAFAVCRVCRGFGRGHMSCEFRAV